MTRQTAATDARRGPNRARLARNIRACYDRATDDERASGASWYDDAHDIATEIGSGDVVKGAGVLAALSPRAQWPTNVAWARESLTTGQAVGNMTANRAKAQRIIDGEHPDDVLGGAKVTTFYRNILAPGSCDGVTVDRHAFDIATGHRNGSNDKARSILSNTGIYNRFADAYRDVAADLGICPAALQAITWVAWRRRENGVTS